MISQRWQEYPRIPRATLIGPVPFFSRVQAPTIAVLGAIGVAIALLIAGMVTHLAARFGFSYPQSAVLAILIGLGWRIDCSSSDPQRGRQFPFEDQVVAGERQPIARSSRVRI